MTDWGTEGRGARAPEPAARGRHEREPALEAEIHGGYNRARVREPQEREVDAAGLRLQVYEWDGGGRDTAILCHGFLDHARAWDFVVAELPRSWHVIAFDWRGHGRSAWVGAGAYYHFADYLVDLAAVVEGFARDRLLLCGHSLGGGVAAYYAACRPERVRALALLEGLGPPAGRSEDTPDSAIAFLHAVRRLRGRKRHSLRSLDEAAQRIRSAHPRIGEAEALHLARHGTRAEPGAFHWRYDPMHRVPFPQPFYLEAAMAFWRRIRCPVLLLEGSESPYAKLPDLDRRRACLAKARRDLIVGVDHMMHVEAPQAVAHALSEFWSRL